jgi:DNA polymerase III psi subunit
MQNENGNKEVGENKDEVKSEAKTEAKVEENTEKKVEEKGEIKTESQPKIKASKPIKSAVPKMTIRQILESQGKDMNWLLEKLRGRGHIVITESVLSFYVDNDIKPEKKLFGDILKALNVSKAMVATRTAKIAEALNIQGRTQQWLLSRLHDKGHTKLDAPQLSRYANGNTTPRNTQIILDIAEILGVNSEIFF